jgi:hypothetical protein
MTAAILTVLIVGLLLSFELPVSRSETSANGERDSLDIAAAAPLEYG